jgi:hypothetical protein
MPAPRLNRRADVAPGLTLYRKWWARHGAFLSLRAAAARLYDETRAADMLSDNGQAPCQAACLDYHARQLVHHAKYGKATFYGKKIPGTALEPIARNDLWTGRCTDDMNGWITETGVEYTDLSLRYDDLRRVTRQVKQAVKDHDALLAWCRRHAPSSR